LDLHHLTGATGPTADYQQASLWSLVLAAVDIPHELAQREGQWLLLVPGELEPAARREIAAFEEENLNWPPPAATPDSFSLAPGQHPPTVLAMGALLIFHLQTGPWVPGSPWFEAGAVHSDRILHGGEWWRLVTGLTLHADSVHLFGNLLIGGVLVHFLCKRLGSGLGWFLILLTGILGNLLNILLRGEHQAVGFSTAVFGTIGLLSGMQIHRGAGLGRGLLLPLGAAFSLLAFLGTEGARTDLGAHLWGLAAGLVLGTGLVHVASWQRLATSRWQDTFFLACLILVGTSWYLACT
jgi:rhomboid protease GluP